MQKVDKQKTTKLNYAQQKKREEIMNHPINQFLSAKNDDGTVKYPVAETLMTYFLKNPDLVLNDQRKVYAYVHEFQWRKKNMIDYKFDSEQDEGRKVKDKHGEIMSKKDCYLAYLSEKINLKAVLANLRKILASDLLGKCDGNVLTFDQYNSFVLEIERLIKEEGYDLFPKHLEMIESL